MNLKKILVLVLFLSINQLFSFDPDYYITTNQDLPELQHFKWWELFKHYVHIGSVNNKFSAEPIKNSNFDWQFYRDHNNISTISSEKEALIHYSRFGQIKNLPTCPSYSIAILVHLYHISLLDDFIEQIRNFIMLNNHNSFYISFNIPVAQNLDLLFNKSILKYSREEMLVYMQNFDCYNFGVITPQNCYQLFNIRNYIIQKLSSPKAQVDVMFSENRGLDIGGFLLQMDQLIKKDIKHDFIVKIHSKSIKIWRKMLLSIINIQLGELLSNYEAIYTCKCKFNLDHLDNDDNFAQENLTNVQNLLKTFDLPEINFNYSGGTMFIVSKRFTEFFKKYQLQNLFSNLSMGRTSPSGMLEHALERLFGYIFTYLNLKTKVIGYYSSKNAGIRKKRAKQSLRNHNLTFSKIV